MNLGTFRIVRFWPRNFRICRLWTALSKMCVQLLLGGGRLQWCQIHSEVQWRPSETACAIYIYREREHSSQSALQSITNFLEFPKLPLLSWSVPAVLVLITVWRRDPHPVPVHLEISPLLEESMSGLMPWLGFQRCAPLYRDICFSSVQRRGRRSRVLAPLQHQYRGSICCHDVRATEREELELN